MGRVLPWIAIAGLAAAAPAALADEPATHFGVSDARLAVISGDLHGSATGQIGTLRTIVRRLRPPIRTGQWQVVYYDILGRFIALTIVSVSGGGPPEPRLADYGAASATVKEIVHTTETIERDTRKYLTLDVTGTLEPDGPGRCRLANLEVSSQDTAGVGPVVTARPAAGALPVISIRSTKGGSILGRTTIRLGGGSVLRLRGALEGATLDCRGSVSGPLARTPLGRATVPIVNGTLALGERQAVVDVDFVAEWTTPTRGTVTFTRPEPLAGTRGTISRSPDGGYRVRGPRGRPPHATVSPDGSGSIDIGFGPVAVQFATSTGPWPLDAGDPGDDVAAGATTLSPASGGTFAQRTLSRVDLQDWYGIDLEFGTLFGASLSPASGAKLELLDDQFAAPTFSGETDVIRRTGRYFVRVAPDPAGPRPFGSLTYDLTWSAVGASAAEAVVLSPSWGTLQRASESREPHWYRMDLAAGAQVEISFTPPRSPGAASVWRGGQAGEITPLGGAGNPVRIAAESAGTYYLRVADPSSQGAYRLDWTAVLGTGNGRFGTSVAADGDVLAVSDSTAGTVDVFTRSAGCWTSAQRLSVSTQGYGWSVAVSGDDIAVTGSDGVRVYTRAAPGGSWTEQAKVDGSTYDSIGLSNGTLVVGRYVSGYAGYAFVWGRDGSEWTLRQTLTSSEGGVPDTFGASVAVSGDSLVVGAPGLSAARGAAFVFTRPDAAGSWTQQQKLVATNATPGAYLGEPVTIEGDTIVASAWSDDAVHVFTRSGGVWTEQQRIASPLGASGWFGYSLAVLGDTLVVSAPEADAAVVYGRAAGAWTERRRVPVNDAGGSEYATALLSDAGVLGAPDHGRALVVHVGE